MELVGRLDRIAEGAFPYTASVAAEAAACIREMVEEKAAMQARLDRWEPKIMFPPSVSSGDGARCNKVLSAMGRPYPRTCFVCRLGPCRDEIVPHALPPAPGAEA
nr:hypothetical protein [uncultured Brevundimonas sp.]